jgi:acetyltransferase-like isoleucine patch superfamily enzyme
MSIDSFIDPTARIGRDYSIGDHTAIGFCVYCSTQLRIGHYVHLGVHTSIIGGAIGLCVFDDFSWTSAGVRIACCGETPDGLVGPTIPIQYRNFEISKIVTFERFSGAYMNAVVLPGCTLHEGAVLAAGAVLTDDAEEWTIYAGVPAKPIKMRNSKAQCYEYAEKLGYAY